LEISRVTGSTQESTTGVERSGARTRAPDSLHGVTIEFCILSGLVGS
jgi:hypothetical protein